jgi:hypothetical protein
VGLKNRIRVAVAFYDQYPIKAGNQVWIEIAAAGSGPDPQGRAEGAAAAVDRRGRDVAEAGAGGYCLDFAVPYDTWHAGSCPSG